MDDLDFSGKPASAPAPKPVAKPKPPSEPASLYEPRLALEFFKIAGTLEQFPAGKQIFAENEKAGGLFSKGARIYLLLDGDVTLTLKGKPVELVLPRPDADDRHGAAFAAQRHQACRNQKDAGCGTGSEEFAGQENADGTAA